MKIRQGKDIILRWKISTNGEALPLEGRNLTLILSTPNGRERVLSYTTEGDTISARLFGKEITLLGDYTLTLWENRGEQGQTAVDAVNAFELVKYTTMEDDGSPCGNLEAEVLSLSGDLGVFQQGTTTEKNEQVDRNTADIAELQEDVNAINITLDDLEKADASLREEIANAKDKDAEQDEEITSLLNILEGKLDIKDLGSGLRPDQAVSEIISYVRTNNIKSALVFKYIDIDNSSTFGICISRMGTSGWIIYLVARKGLEVLKFNSYGSRETWNEYGGVLRHDMNSVADEQLECLSIKGLKSVLVKKQDTLVSGTNIKTINDESIMGKGNIEIEAGITEEEKAEINAKIEGKANIADVEELAQELATKAPKVGYAPNLKVNFAKELVGRGESTPEVIGGIRPTGVRSIGDGNATITKIRGESVVWNQFNFRIEKTHEEGGLTFKLDPLTQTITINGTANSNFAFFGVSYGCKTVPAGHNAYVLVKMQGEATATGHVETSLIGNPRILLESGSVSEGIWAATANCYFRINFKSGDVFNNFVIHALLVDLTSMFNAGNEPTTIADFEARKPLGVSNEYNEGTIVSYNGANELKSVGFNAWNGSKAKVIGGKPYMLEGTFTSIGFTKEIDGELTTITVPSDKVYTPSEDGYIYAQGTDVCIHLKHTYTPESHSLEYEDDVHPLPNISAIKDVNGNQLFPHGLLSAGSVYDEITATKAIKRVGVVDMGELNWYLNQKGPRFMATLPKTKSIENWNRIGLLNATKYKVGIVGGPEYEGNIGVFSNNLYVQDNIYTDATLFKQAMSGVLLYYELAEPIEVDLPEPLNMTYEAWDFGTEELVAEGATTPLNADIVYEFNAVDRIRKNSKHVEESEAKLTSMEQRIAQLESMIASLTNTTNDEQM